MARLDRWVAHPRAPWVVFGAFAVVYVATIGNGFVSVDVLSNSVAAQHFVTAWNPWVEHVPYLHPDGRDLFLGTHGNHLYIGRTPGQIVAALPLYWLMARGDNTVQILPGALTAALLVAGAMALVFAGLRRVLTPALAVLAVAAVGLTTPVWSVAADALWTHPVTVIGLGITIWGAAVGRSWWAGAGYAVGIMARPHMAVVAFVHGVHEAVVLRSPKPLLQIGLPSATSLALSLAWDRYLSGAGGAIYGKPTGNVIPGSDASAHGYSLPVNVLEFFLAPSRGLLVWTPMLVVLAVVVVRRWRAQPTWTRALALGGLAYCALQCVINVFSGGSAFYGYRLAIEPLLCFAPICFTALSPVPAWVRRVLPVLVGWQFAVIAIGAAGTGAQHDAIQHDNVDQTNSPWPNGTWSMVHQHWWWLVPAMVVLGIAGWYAARWLLLDSAAGTPGETANQL